MTPLDRPHPAERGLADASTYQRWSREAWGLPTWALVAAEEPETAHDDQPSIAATVIVHQHWLPMTRRRLSEGSFIWGSVAGRGKAGEGPGQAAIQSRARSTSSTMRNAPSQMAHPSQAAERTVSTGGTLHPPGKELARVANGSDLEALTLASEEGSTAVR